MSLLSSPGARLAPLLPGLALCLAVAVTAHLAAPLLRAASGGFVALPAMVLALALGILANGPAAAPRFQPGITFAVKTLLRWAIALLGLRIAIGDIVALGAGTALAVIAVMAITIAGTILAARLMGRSDGLGALAGAANAVCGASATLATATALPDYREKSADIAFCVVMANAVSTVAMLAYPPLSALAGFDPSATGRMLGLTIQDMAQVVGAGYAVSEPAGNAAVIVKLFRVFLLLPVVLAIGAWFRYTDGASGAARVPMPVFAFVFIGLALVNSILPATALAPSYLAVKGVLDILANWGMLVAIAALGLGTSVAALVAIGWRHVVVFLAGALIVLAAGTGAVLVLP